MSAAAKCMWVLPLTAWSYYVNFIIKISEKFSTEETGY